MFLDSEILTNTEQTEIRKHKTISINLKRSIKLYLHRIGQSLMTNRLYDIQSWKYKKLTKLYNEADEKICNDLNVVKLIKNLRDLRIMVNSTMMDRMTKFQIDHSKKNIINIESSVESSESFGSDHSNESEKKLEQLEKWIEQQKRLQK